MSSEGSGDIVAELAVKLGLIPEEGEFEHGNELIEKIKHGLEFFAGFEAMKGLFELVGHTTEAAVANKHLAERLGMSIEGVQELSYAADVTGASVEDMRVSLQHLSFGMTQAAKTGKGPLIDGLNKLKISFSSFQKEKPEDRIATLAGAFSKLPPGVDKTALSIEMFGRKGTTLLPLLNKGAAGVAELRKEFVDLGAETSAEDAEKLEEMEIQQKKLKYMWGGIKDEVVMSLLPVLQEVLKSFFDWAKANRELIAGTLKGAIEAVVAALKIFGTVMGVVAQIIDFLAEHAEMGRAVLYALGVMIAYVAGEAIIAWVGAKLVFAAAVAAIAALIAAFEWLAEGVEEGSEPIMALVTFLGGVLLAIVIPAMITGLQMLADYIVFVVVPALAAAAAAAWGFAVALLSNPFTWLAMAIVGAVLLIHKYWDPIADFFTGLWDGIVEGCKGAFEFIRNLPVVGELISLVEGLIDLVSSPPADMNPLGHVDADGNWAAPNYNAQASTLNGNAGSGDTTINQQNSIAINGTGLSADEVKDAITESHENLLRTAHGAVTGNG